MKDGQAKKSHILTFPFQIGGQVCLLMMDCCQKSKKAGENMLQNLCLAMTDLLTLSLV